MPRKKAQIPGQIDLPLSATEEQIEKPKRGRKKKTEIIDVPKSEEQPKKTRTKATTKKAPTIKHKKYTKSQYKEAVEITEKRGRICAGTLINRFRIPAYTALDMIAKMQEDQIITEKRTLVKKKEITWKEDSKG